LGVVDKDEKEIQQEKKLVADEPKQDEGEEVYDTDNEPDSED
jgi:hypothetical protein